MSTFFDTAFLINRGWYEADRDYDILLAGIAYDGRPAQTTRMPFTPNPDQIAWERMMAEEYGTRPQTLLFTLTSPVPLSSSASPDGTWTATASAHR